MYDSGKVIAGLIVFVLLVTLPIWYNVFAGKDEPELQKVDPKIAAECVIEGKGACVEDPEWMRANHMQLLNQWRDEVVREGKRVHTSMTTGDKYWKSLGKPDGCLCCHTDQAKFCDKCHDYAGISETIYCWECHVAPEEAK